MTSSKKKVIRRRPGDVVRIELGNSRFGYGRVLGTSMAFYDLVSPPELPVTEIVKRPVLFTIWVMNYAISDGDWPIIAHLPLERELAIEPVYFKKDPITKALSIYHDSTGEEFPASRSECEGLECAAAWEPEHVVDRLNDQFAGRPNIWVESLRP